jgi:hypothetical protein
VTDEEIDRMIEILDGVMRDVLDTRQRTAAA